MGGLLVCGGPYYWLPVDVLIVGIGICGFDNICCFRGLESCIWVEILIVGVSIWVEILVWVSGLFLEVRICGVRPEILFVGIRN